MARLKERLKITMKEIKKAFESAEKEIQRLRGVLDIISNQSLLVSSKLDPSQLAKESLDKKNWLYVGRPLFEGETNQIKSVIQEQTVLEEARKIIK